MNKSDTLAAIKKQPVAVEVGGGVSVFVKPLTVRAKEEFAAWRRDNPGPVGVVGRLLALSLSDETGALLLSGPEEAADLDGDLADRLCDRILEINNMKAPDPKKGSSPNGPV
jgi:hypothetical protein